MLRIIAISGLAILIFSIGLYYGRNFHTLISGIDPAQLLNTFISSMATLVAGFGGAYAAFWLSKSKEREAINKARISSLAKVQAECALQINNIKDFKFNVIDPAKEKPDSWISMQPIPYVEPGEKIKASELSFLIELDRPSLLIELEISQISYMRNLMYLKRRSDLLINTVYPQMIKSGYPLSSKFNIDQLTSVVGEMVVHELKGMTDAILSMTDSTIEDLNKASDNLLSVMKSIDKNAKGITIESQANQGH